MSDTSRKRSRKSKLVPRQCSLEDDVEFQDLQTPMFEALKIMMDTKNETQDNPFPIIKTETCNLDILKKLSVATMENTEQTSPIKFDIQVEVEQCDDDISGDMTSDDIMDSFMEISEKNESKPFRKVVFTHNAKKIEQNTSIPLPVPLSETKILKAADEILENSTNPADRILDIGVRNTIGHERKGPCYTNMHDDLIQETLDDWKTWQFKSFHRESPLFYKCYICNLSWWNLSEFRDHVSNHPVLNMELEQYEKQEINLVAFAGKRAVMEDIYTAGFCNKCGDDYDAHKLSNRYRKKYYKNNGCTRFFFNCVGLKNHVPSCCICDVDDKPFKCQICKNSFDTDELLWVHLGLCHDVRSDVPTECRYTACKECNARYMSSNLHICGKKGPQVQCRYCFLSFPNINLIELHMENSSEPYNCDICGQVLLWNCKKYEHMMTHTDKYTLVWKCVICEKFEVFLTNDAALRHRFTKHPEKDNKYQFIIKILVPKSCLEPELEPKEEPMPETVSESETKFVPGSDKVSVPIPELQQDGVNIIVKEEPLDIVENPIQIIVKKEKLDPDENTADEITSDYNPDIDMSYVKIKQEYDDNECEDDIIKLNIDINNAFAMSHAQLITPKQEPVEEPLTEEPFGHETSEYPIIIKQESILEPEVILNQNGRRRKRIYTCRKCGYGGLHKDYKKHVNTDCKRTLLKETAYYCTKCNRQYMGMKKYLSHFVDHGFQSLSCPECLLEHYCFPRLIAHVQSHIRQSFVRVKLITENGSRMKPEYQCKKCSEVVVPYLFFNHWELHVHSSPEMAAAHLKMKAKQIKLQDAQEETIKESLRRLLKFTKECNQCQRKFNRMSECKRHIIEHLLTHAYTHKHESGELICQKCGLGFLLADKYKQHMRDHAALPVYKCEICDRSFSDSSNFTKHKKVHNLKVFVCDLCGKKFQSKLSLEKHVVLHATTKPIPCVKCDKIFYFDSSYRRHVRYFHDKISVGFRCVICNKRFPSLKVKWNHMWEVHKERTQKADCPICSKSFRKYTDVRAHARIEHNVDVSVYRVKTKKPMVEIGKYMENKTTFLLGNVETLVVYE